MVTLIIILSVLFTVLLCLIILAQDGKGGGFSGGATGAAQIMGVKKTTDILERLTFGFIGAIVILSISTGFLVGNPDMEEGDVPGSVNIDKARESAPAAPAPATSGNGAMAPAADSAKK